MRNLHSSEWADATDVNEVDVKALPLPPAIPAAAPPWKMATLLLACPNQPGIVAEVAQLLHSHGANIVDSAQHTDALASMFFQRLRLDLSSGTNRVELEAGVRDLTDRLGMNYRLYGDRKRRVAIMCSKQEHCLYDLLVRYRAGELPCDLAMIVSNHMDAAPIAKHFGIPFHHMPVASKELRDKQETAVLDLLHQAGIELVVLARYMQILSARFVERFPYRIINIHHSFLPAFVGANPYRQAYEKGVKLIGATSHYVTADLDQGPIIEQETIRVSHRDTPEDLQRKGKDLEKRVLAGALRWHLEDRVLIHSNKTIVFDYSATVGGAVLPAGPSLTVGACCGPDGATGAARSTGQLPAHGVPHAPSLASTSSTLRGRRDGSRSSIADTRSSSSSGTRATRDGAGSTTSRGDLPASA